MFSYEIHHRLLKYCTIIKENASKRLVRFQIKAPLYEQFLIMTTAIPATSLIVYRSKQYPYSLPPVWNGIPGGVLC